MRAHAHLILLLPMTGLSVHPPYLHVHLSNKRARRNTLTLVVVVAGPLVCSPIRAALVGRDQAHAFVRIKY
jgi:hypothetical protein